MSIRALRNFGVIAHINAGKTTLTERILFSTGKQRFLGDVDSGTAAMDWLPEEQTRGISIGASCTAVPWRGLFYQLIDTPGHVDFTSEVERSLRVLDGVVVVIDAGAGIEPQTEAVWQRAASFGLPAVVFVNKVDRAVPDWPALIESIAGLTGRQVIPLAEPCNRVGSPEQPADAVRDLLSGKIVGDTTGGVPTWYSDPEAARDALVDRVTECDEEALARFVEDGELDDKLLHAAIRRATFANAAVPMVPGSALRGVGVDLLLDAIGRYLPCPADRPRQRALVGEAHDDELAALVFKVIEDVDPARLLDDDASPRLGQIRLFAGSIRNGDRIESMRDHAFVVEGLCRVHATRREPIEVAGPGEIVGLDLPADVGTGATLRRPGSKLMLEPVAFSHPAMTYGLEPESADDLPGVAAAARRLIVHDPTLRLDQDAGSGELRISGMGELQIAIFHERLEKLVGVPVRLGAQRVAHAETVVASATGDAECKRVLPRSDGSEVVIAAAVRVRVAPSEEHGEASVVPAPALVQRAVPGLRQVLSTLRKQARAGFIEGCPVRDAELVVESIDSHGASTDDAELTAAADLLVQEAARLAARRAFESAGHRVMVPVVRFQVACPHDTVRSVLADLRSRGARIGVVGGGNVSAEIRGEVPLDRILGYASDLRSLTKGRASLATVIDRFAVPDDLGPNGA